MPADGVHLAHGPVAMRRALPLEDRLEGRYKGRTRKL